MGCSCSGGVHSKNERIEEWEKSEVVTVSAGESRREGGARQEIDSYLD